MTQKTKRATGLNLWGVLKGRLRAGRPDDAEAGFNPRAYFYGAWHLLKQDLFLFLWKLLADAARAVVFFGAVAFVGVLLAVQFQAALSLPAGPIAGLEALAADLMTPRFVIGVAGILWMSWLIGLTIDVFLLSGIWGALAAGARGEPIERLRTFASQLSRRFPDVLALRVTTLAAQVSVLILATMVVWAAVVAIGGPLAEASVWVQGLVWAVPLTLLGGLAALVRLTMEVAAAPLMVDQRPLGESILQAAVLVTRRFGQVYRVLLVAATLLLIPLGLYWAVLMFQNLVMWTVPELAAVATVVRLAGEVVLLVGMGAVAVLFYGALFLYYAHEMGMIDEIPGRDDDDEDREASAPQPVGRPVVVPGPPGAGPQGGRATFDEETTLEDLLPDEYPNIVSLEDVLDTGVAQAQPEEQAQPDEQPAPDQPGVEDEPDTSEDTDVSGDDAFDSEDDKDDDSD